jgi:hypothetical protein
MLDDGWPWKKKRIFGSCGLVAPLRRRLPPLPPLRSPPAAMSCGRLACRRPFDFLSSGASPLLFFPSPSPSCFFLSFPSCGSFSLSLVLSLSRSSHVFPIQVLSSVYLLVFILLVIAVLLISVPKEKLNPKPGSLNSN